MWPCCVQHNTKLPTQMLDEAFGRIVEELQDLGKVPRGCRPKLMQPDMQVLGLRSAWPRHHAAQNSCI